MHPIDNIVTSNNFEHCHVYTTRFFQFSVLKSNLFIRALLLDRILVTEKNYAYASRTSCLSSESNESTDDITEELTKITTWKEVNKLLINENRTKIMFFSMPPKRIDALTIRMKGVEIEVVDDFNFLGITINKSLNWKLHVNAFCNKNVKLSKNNYCWDT